MYNLESEEEDQIGSISPMGENSVEVAPQTPGFFSFLFNFGIHIGALQLLPYVIHYAPQTFKWALSKTRRY